MGATCWRCQAEVKREGAYCPTCGAALRPGEGGVGVDWQSRIEREPKGRRTWAYVILAVLAVLAFPATLAVGVLAGPAFGALNNRRLRRHVGERIASPVLAGERFTATREGEEIRRKLDRLAARGPLSYAWVVQYLLLLAAGLVLFVGAAGAPSYVNYEDALEDIFEVESAWGWRPVDSKDEFDWQVEEHGLNAWDVKYETVRGRAPDPREGLPTSIHSDGHSSGNRREPAYEFVHTGTWKPEVRQAKALRLRWRESETLGAVFWTLGGTYLATLPVVHFLYWLKFMRHRTTEVLAAAYARGDVKFHDEVMGKAQGHNHGLMFGAIALSVTQLHVVVFPWMGPLSMHLHEGWEKRVGVAPALGIK